MKKFFLAVLQLILRILASSVLRRKNPEIVAITGSVAKTSTKEATYQVLSKKFEGRVAKSEGNLNNEIGLPIAILGFKHSPRWFSWPFILFWAVLKTFAYSLSLLSYPKILILEMAADKPGDIQYLVSFASPKVGVVTAVGPSHLEAFGTIEKVAEEKAKLVEALPESGFAVLNRKDPFVLEMAKKTKAYIKYFFPDNPDIPFSIATLVGQIYGLKNEEIQKGLKNFRPQKGRMNILRGISDSIIIDDCYNANPLSTSFALNFLKIYPGKRKIAVLGDMLELGDWTKRGHQEMGQKAKETCDLLLATGDKAQIIAQEGKGLYFKTKNNLIGFLKKEIREGDIILVKASRAMRFEEIVNEVKSKE